MLNLMEHRIELDDDDDDDDEGRVYRTGWLPPYPDLRDYTEHDVRAFLPKLSIREVDPGPLPVAVDLSSWFGAAKTQGNLGSCTAQAGTSIVEYYQERAFGKSTRMSRRFLYKTTRGLLRLRGDTGAYLRTTMAALRMFGVPPESYFKYSVKHFDKSPGIFLYSMADNWEALTYFCHDPLSAEKKGAAVLDSVRKYLAAGVPSMFGFWVFDNFERGRMPGQIPYPNMNSKCVGGHAVTAVGYDDNKVVLDAKTNQSTKGAIFFLNSWGKSWGENGYGWIPYSYVINKLADDFWSLLSMEWVDTGEFGL